MFQEQMLDTLDLMATTLDPETKTQAPAWLKAGFGLMLMLLVTAFFFSASDTATYFGHSHESVIWVMTLIVWAPTALASAITLHVVGIKSRMGRLGNAVWTVWSGMVLGGVFAATFHMFAMRIDHWLLFPAAATRTIKDIEAPIAGAYATHGKNAADHIRLPPVPDSVKISPRDYGILAVDALHHEAGRDPDDFRVAGRYCARITLQLAGAAARILHAGDSTLPTGSVHPCPRSYIDYLAGLNGLAAIPD